MGPVESKAEPQGDLPIRRFARQPSPGSDIKSEIGHRGIPDGSDHTRIVRRKSDGSLPGYFSDSPQGLRDGTFGDGAPENEPLRGILRDTGTQIEMEKEIPEPAAPNACFLKSKPRLQGELGRYEKRRFKRQTAGRCTGWRYRCGRD